MFLGPNKNLADGCCVVLMLDYPHLSWQPAVAGQSDVVDEHGQASPVIGWNDLHILYQLPDGSMWAEHGNLYDSEDLVSGYWMLTPILINLRHLYV